MTGCFAAGAEAGARSGASRPAPASSPGRDFVRRARRRSRPTLTVDGARDVDGDGDGRPDFDVVYELGEYKGCDYCSGGRSSSASSPTLVPTVRSRSTTRSRSPRRSVAAPPPPGEKLVVDPGEPIDDGAVACARLWGRSKARLCAAIARECAPFARESAACAGPCKYRELNELEAAFDPPLRLAR